MVDVHNQGGASFEKKLDVSPLEQFRRGLQYCTGITAPSKVLLSDWQMYAPTWLVPNYIDAPRYTPYRKMEVKTPGEIIIGWGGSMSHRISFLRSGVSLALRRVLQKYKHVKFMLCGDKRILDVVKLPPDQVIFRNYVTFNEWPAILKDFDIKIAPLQGVYDWSRSGLKIAEGSTMAIPTVATGCPTYEDYETAGLGYYIPDTLDITDSALESRAIQWENRLSDIIEHYADYKRRAIDDAVNLAPRWWVDNRVHDISKTYESIIEHG